MKRKNELIANMITHAGNNLGFLYFLLFIVSDFFSSSMTMT